ncbi:hypothetical protein Peur_048853 [Populus x canadensis]
MIKKTSIQTQRSEFEIIRTIVYLHGTGHYCISFLSFDELLELRHRGSNRAVDTVTGDIYGGKDYSKIGLSSTTIASSFGKAISDSKELEDYKPEGISRSLLILS